MSENKIIPVPEMEYHANGEPKFKASVYDDGSLQSLAYFNKDGKLNGPYTKWYEDGQKWVEWNYKNNNLHGLLTDWHPNGNKWREVNFVNGKKDGLATKWHKNGEKQAEGNWVNGKLHGKKTIYNCDGSIFIVEYYNKGIKVKELKDVE